MLCSSTSSLLLYVTISVMSFFLTLHSTLFHSDNYFSGTIIYFTDPLTNMILYNFVTALTVFTYRCLLLLYFDDIRQSQTLKLIDKLKIKIFDLIFFFYFINLQFSFKMYVTVLFILLMFVIHHHCSFRTEFLIHSNLLSLNLHKRLGILFLILLFIDYEIAKYAIPMMFSQQPLSLMFAYYMLTTSMLILEPFVSFSVDFYEKYTGRFFHNSDEFLALVAVIINVTRLLLQIALSGWITMQFGFTIFLGFTLAQCVSQLGKTFSAFSRLKKLTQTMKNLRKISQQQLATSHDITCNVCFHDMKQATLLPCKHFFHNECLRQWIIKNANHFCPKCKRPFNFQAQNKLDQEQALLRQEYVMPPREKRNVQPEKNEILGTRQPERSEADSGRLNHRLPANHPFNETNAKFNALLFDNFFRPSYQHPFSLHSSLDQQLQIGSLPFNMPTPAVANRQRKHILARQSYIRSTQYMLSILQMSKIQQLLLIGE